jgi:hypothetical protein
MAFVTPQMLLKAASKIADDELYCIALFVADTDVDRSERIEDLKQMKQHLQPQTVHYLDLFTKRENQHTDLVNETLSLRGKSPIQKDELYIFAKATFSRVRSQFVLEMLDHEIKRMEHRDIRLSAWQVMDGDITGLTQLFEKLSLDF